MFSFAILCQLMYSIWYFLYMPVRKQPSHNSGVSSCTVHKLNSQCMRQWPLRTLLITAVFNRFMWNVIIFIFQILLYYTCSILGIWFKFDYTTHSVRVILILAKVKIRTLACSQVVPIGILIAEHFLFYT